MALTVSLVLSGITTAGALSSDLFSSGSSGSTAVVEEDLPDRLEGTVENYYRHWGDTIEDDAERRAEDYAKQAAAGEFSYTQCRDWWTSAGNDGDCGESWHYPDGGGEVLITRFTTAGAERYIAMIIADMQNPAEPTENFRVGIATAATGGFIYLVEYDPYMVLGV